MNYYRNSFLFKDRKSNSMSFVVRIQWICFCIIGLNMLWPYFSETPISRFHSVACLCIFCTVMLNVVFGLDSHGSTKGNGTFYSAFITWSILMILVFHYYHNVHKTIDFLFFRTDSYAIFFINVMTSVLPCMLMVDISKIKLGKTFKVIVLIVVIVTAFFALRAIAINPNALRERGRMEREEGEGILIGTPSYSNTYGYALLLPAFLHRYRMASGKNRIYYMTVVLILSYIVLVAQFATALIIAIVGILAYLYIISDHKKRTLIASVAIPFAIIFLFSNMASDFLLWVAANVEGVWSEKLKDIAMTLSAQSATGSVAGRIDYYTDSFNAFFASPIFGMFNEVDGVKIGGHAVAIDVLGMSGIIGFIPFSISVLGNYSRMRKYDSYERAKPAMIACVIQFVLLVFLKNIITSFGIFFAYYVLVPLLLKSEDKEIKKR